MANSYDPSAQFANELLGYFARNTAVKIEHKFAGNTLEVKSARTGNVIATVSRDKGVFTVDGQFDFVSLQFVASFIAGMRRFPKPRNTKKAWSPIRLSADSIRAMEHDSGIRFA